VLLRYLYVQQQWRLHVHAQARARVQALQARIRPHFLFNSMNTISSLIRGRPRDAEQAVEDLSELFRASLKAEEFIPLRDELGITRNYLDIEHLRIGDRLRVSWSVDEQVDLDIPVPCLSLQPLVENAVYHGIEPRIEGGEISISVGKRGEQLFIQVRNPLPDKAHLRRGHHMAQDNIRQRLELSYGQRAGLVVKELEQAYEVVLSLPSRGAFE
jgi:two-component system sensor histidine kinase AlgZ